MRPQRQSSLQAAAKIAAQADTEPPLPTEERNSSKRKRRDASESPSFASVDDDDKDEHARDGRSPFFAETLDSDDALDLQAPPPKRQKTTARSKPITAKYNKAEAAKLCTRLFTSPSSTPANPNPAQLPTRDHAVTYHRSLLLSPRDGLSARAALLAWFDNTSSNRGMPWRQPFLVPNADPPPSAADLNRRAYQVWISEIMLQQTRVAVVIDYWNRWMAKWPTVADLAAASQDEVVSMWRGLGYYSRATRIHEAAKLVMKEMGGLLPSDAAELEKRLPGVGRYTAGAISAIVFGKAEALVDGNVLRVLSRQLGILGDVKGDRRVIDVLWAAAEALARQVAKDGTVGDIERSDRPGRWGQGLMELGSTICTPNPSCGSCPITATCRAYAEGASSAMRMSVGANGKRRLTGDIEDICELCEPIDLDDLPKSPGKANKSVKRRKGATSEFFEPGKPSSDKIAAIAQYAAQFPLKVVKNARREEELLVCAIRRSDGRYLISRRPAKGLLAGLWELPSHALPASGVPVSKRKQMAVKFVSGLLDSSAALRHSGEVGTVPWLFSHLKSTMHVHLFELDMSDTGSGRAMKDAPSTRWASAEEIDAESMGTGMRKCWAEAKSARD